MDIEEIYARMGRNLMHLRAQYGMSRKTLAKLIDIPQTRLRRLANVFALSTDSLLYEDLCKTES